MKPGGREVNHDPGDDRAAATAGGVPGLGHAIGFIALTCLLSAGFWFALIRWPHRDARNYTDGLMWCPALAALLVCGFAKARSSDLGLRWGGWRSALTAYLLPVAYALVAYSAIWGLGLGRFPAPAAISAAATRLGWEGLSSGWVACGYALLLGTTGMVSAVARALGEEIGWRGFLAPILVQRIGFVRASVAGGAVWSVWHFPLIVWADYNAGTPLTYALVCFTVMVISLSVILNWLRLVSRSVWPCAILHGSHNLWLHAYFTPMTESRGQATAWFVDEFGIAVPLVCALLATGLIWKNRRNGSAFE